MTPQVQAFWIFVAMACLVAGFFLWVARSTRQAHEVNQDAARRLRRNFFYSLTGLLVIVLALTLRHMPYPVPTERPERIIFVVGKQFAFGISSRPIADDADWEAATYSAPVQIPTGAMVEFRVSSFDVNHGFAVYSPSGELLGQVQAMPGYVNRLRMRFRRPGIYHVFCLEFCGMDHYRMRGLFFVVPRTNTQSHTRSLLAGTGE